MTPLAPEAPTGASTVPGAVTGHPVRLGPSWHVMRGHGADHGLPVAAGTARPLTTARAGGPDHAAPGVSAGRTLDGSRVVTTRRRNAANVARARRRTLRTARLGAPGALREAGL
jgi:hypothetical protein